MVQSICLPSALYDTISLTCPRRIMDKTSPSEGGNAGSIPAEDTLYVSKIFYVFLRATGFFMELNGVLGGGREASSQTAPPIDRYRNDREYGQPPDQNARVFTFPDTGRSIPDR